MRLSLATMRHAYDLAKRREAASVTFRHKGLNAGGGFDFTTMELTGAVGECAVAEVLGLPLPVSVNTFKTEPDLPPHFEVRTGTKPHYGLIVRDDDPDDRVYVLVTLDLLVQPWDVRVVGWMSGAEAKDPRWLRSPHGKAAAYFLPQSALSSMRVWVPSVEPVRTWPRVEAPSQLAFRWG